MSSVLIFFALGDIDQLAQQRHGIGVGALERIAPDDRAIAATIADGFGFFEQAVLALFTTTREHHNSASTKAAMHHMTHALNQRTARNVMGLVDFLGFGLVKMVGRQFYLDDMCAQQGNHVGGISHDVKAGFSVFADAFAARI